MTLNEAKAGAVSVVEDLLNKQGLLFASQASDVLGTSRQRISWFMRKLEKEGKAHHAHTYTVMGTRHYLWFPGASSSLSKEEMEAMAAALTLPLRALLVPETAFKTIWAGGVNPWTKEKIH